MARREFDEETFRQDFDWVLEVWIEAGLVEETDEGVRKSPHYTDEKVMAAIAEKMPARIEAELQKKTQA